MGPISATSNYGPVGLSELWIRRQLRFRLKKRATTATRAMIFFFKLATFSTKILKKVYPVSYFSKIAICHPLDGRLGHNRRLIG
jgi:hypothetical protein